MQIQPQPSSLLAQLPSQPSRRPVAQGSSRGVPDTCWSICAGTFPCGREGVQSSSRGKQEADGGIWWWCPKACSGRTHTVPSSALLLNGNIKALLPAGSMDAGFPLGATAGYGPCQLKKAKAGSL